MKANLNDKYRRAAEEFARRVTSAMGDQIDSIVLYGSVARGEAWEESDIDILVISSNGRAMRDRVGEIEDDLAYDSGYAFHVSVVVLTTDEFHDRVEHGYPFIGAVFEDGVVLHDNGTFARVREEAVGVS